MSQNYLTDGIQTIFINTENPRTTEQKNEAGGGIKDETYITYRCDSKLASSEILLHDHPKMIDRKRENHRKIKANIAFLPQKIPIDQTVSVF